MTRPWALTLGAVACLAAPSAAQTLGTFSWQLQPLCNRVVATVQQVGGAYTLDGYDDQCGAATRAPLTGLATPNPDGSIGLGLTIITSPGATPIHVDARMALPALSGSWSDSHGNTGTFAFGAAAPGSARPAPPSGLSWGRTFVSPVSTASAGLAVRRDAPPAPSQRGLKVEWGPGGTAGIVLGSSPIGLFADAADRPAIVGASDTGTAVSARSLTGRAVLGFAAGTVASARGISGQATGGGTGVSGESVLSTAVAADSRNAVALRVQGPIAVSGARAPAFVHTTSSANTTLNATTINHPLTNGRPAALLFVTRRSGSDPAVTSVAYDAGSGRWRIVHDNLSAMPLGRSFTVLVIDTCPPGTLCIATVSPGVRP
ncbi:MAG: hypothetical protein R2708_12910 [Vicinamibacterales bacterium]